MFANIECISYYLSKNDFDNYNASKIFSNYTPEKIYQKTGINNRKIANANEFSSDLATSACEALFLEHKINRSEIDYLILCTQSPDYLMPTTACIVHKNLGLQNWCGAININQGCSGFIYSLGVAKGLLETHQAENVLLITSETYSKHLEPSDHSTRTIFGDGAASILINRKANYQKMNTFLYGTDGSGLNNLISYKGGMKSCESNNNYFYMNGPEVFHFAINAVPEMFKKLISDFEINLNEIDFFIFHQANKYMLDSLKNKLKIPDEKFLCFMSEHGNTVSASIPIVFSEFVKNKTIKRGDKIIMVGFGIGYSYSLSVIDF
ncbi:ketoacyl-ACP synthase III [Fluviispira vulneris]|uniref:ketoacyl-ACP synthase III n=1 Tax=Fluviispira vulneris TaxID=2763012 RepID=UPI001647F028|nr:ketoacyl-ACP synthase III [Fluviispira vulneris]